MRTCLEFPEPDIAMIVFDQPDRGTNLLSSQALAELAAHLDTIEQRSDLAGLIFASAKPDVFLAGADLAEVAAKLDGLREDVIAACRNGQQLFARLSQLPCVTLAAIDGVCLGGGAELAMWCDRRIVTTSDKTSIGFPEVKLGLIPGWGGTARTPRMIGLANAVELITAGEPIDGAAAYKLGMADDLVESEQLRAAAIRLIRQEQASRQFVVDRERRSQPIAMSETELGFLGATASAFLQQKTGGHYPALLTALELMLESSQLPLDTACELESERFADLFGSPVNCALLNVYFLRERNKKESAGQESPMQPIRSVAILGAGVMGCGVAAASLRRGIAVQLHDNEPTKLSEGIETILREAAYDKQSKSTDADRVIELVPLLRSVSTLRELSEADLVIEAIVESPDAKQKLLTELEPLVQPDAVLCSNTSTIPIATLAKNLKHPERFCGLHFFNPVRKMPLVEVIRGAATSDATIATAVSYARQLGKSPVVVGDGPGFLVNRLLMPYMNEAALLLEEGVPMEAIEKAAKQFGMPMGPFELYDMVGLDVCLHAGEVMRQAFPDRVASPRVVRRLVEAGRLGQKTGRGFFDYSTDPKGLLNLRPSPVAKEMVAASTSPQSSIINHQSSIQDRLFLPMLLEATRVLEDGLVNDVRDIDLALILGIGFPAFRGGLFNWADTIGAKDILARLKPLKGIGKRYEVSELLRDRAERDAQFYDPQPIGNPHSAIRNPQSNNA